MMRVHHAAASVYAGEARTARTKFREARLRLHALQDQAARPRRSAVLRQRLGRRVARGRALVAGRRTALLWHSAFRRYERERAYQRAAAAHALKQQIAGG
jgi:hypothetical protein